MFRSLVTAAFVLAIPAVAAAQTPASPSAMMHHPAMKSTKHTAMKGTAMHGAMHGSMKGSMHGDAMKASPKP